MSILNREEFFSRIQSMLGDDTSDDTLKIIEDFTDTFNEMEAKAKGDGEDWKEKYENLDSEWRTRYRDRFFNNVDGDDKNHMTNGEEIKEKQKENIISDGEPKTFEELFIEREG